MDSYGGKTHLQDQEGQGTEIGVRRGDNWNSRGGGGSKPRNKEKIPKWRFLCPKNLDRGKSSRGVDTT